MTTLQDGNVVHSREALYRDARHARLHGCSCAEWEASVARDPVFAQSAKRVGSSGMRAIVCLVWKLDRKDGA